MASKKVSPGLVQDDELKTTSATPHSLLSCSTIIASLIAGLLFGWFVQKGNVYIPNVIFRQMKMEQFTMMKMFLSAAATSQICLTLVFLFKKEKYNKVMEGFAGCYPKGIVSTGLGASILGSGMAVCGACPGTVMVQVGTGLQYSGVVLAGGFVGTILYIFLEPFFSNWIDPIGRPSKNRQFLASWFKMPQWKLAIPVAIFLAAIVAILEVFLPYQDDHPYPEFYFTEPINVTAPTDTGLWVIKPVPIISDFTWPPYLSGVVVGLLQLITIFTLQDTLGSSTGWVALIASVMYAIAPKIAKKSAYVMRSRGGAGNLWQIFYYIGAIIAASLAAFSANMLINLDPPTNSFNPIRSFFGGVMILFGSRLAGGCTSGHGISGFGLLNTMSLLAVPFMFAGGIFTAFAIDSFHYNGNFFQVP